MLRIDVNSGNPYAIPPDNPFVDGDPNTLDEIWSYGERNPWRFSFDRLTGDLWMADVGQGSWEEIDLQLAGSPGGENYGWRCYEGNHPYNLSGCGPMQDYTFPVYKYDHTVGCSTTLWSLTPNGGGWQVNTLGTFSAHPSSFGVGNRSEIYMAGYDTGTIYHLVDGSLPTATPRITRTPTPTRTPTRTPRPTRTPTRTPTPSNGE
jgi:hypothetical protein